MKWKFEQARKTSRASTECQLESEGLTGWQESRLKVCCLLYGVLVFLSLSHDMQCSLPFLCNRSPINACQISALSCISCISLPTA
jgi:hypothetical protein